MTLTAPAGGAGYTAPATIGLSASASDADGTVSRVDFYRGQTLIQSDTTSPYTASWSSAPAGTYSLTAIAYDNEGASTTSPAVTVTVNGSTSQGRVFRSSARRRARRSPRRRRSIFEAAASDADGISRVDLYQGGTALLKQDFTSPYSAQLDQRAGWHLSAHGRGPRQQRAQHHHDCHRDGEPSRQSSRRPSSFSSPAATRRSRRRPP